MKIDKNKVLNVVRLIVKAVVCILAHKDKANRHHRTDDPRSRADDYAAHDDQIPQADNQQPNDDDSYDNSESFDRQ